MECSKEGCKEDFKHCHCPTCGESVSTESSYLGSICCLDCNQYMNVFGQALRNPSEWEEDY